MAVQVEDHPLAYAGLEGTIPEQQYGAGKVIIWDKGTWHPLHEPQQAYADGNLKFELRGCKMHGVWVLVRMNRQADRIPEKATPAQSGGNACLLIKEKMNLPGPRPSSASSTRCPTAYRRCPCPCC